MESVQAEQVGQTALGTVIRDDAVIRVVNARAHKPIDVLVLKVFHLELVLLILNQ